VRIEQFNNIIDYFSAKENKRQRSDTARAAGFLGILYSIGILHGFYHL